LDLARKIIEYGITVEYMLWKGKEEMAEQFQKYFYTEIKYEIEFLKSIGQDLKEINEELKINVEDAEKQYGSLNSAMKKRKSWAGMSVDKMIEDLHSAGRLRDFDSSRISDAYIWGCRLNI